METLVMHARIVTIAAAMVLAATGATAAQPVKKPAPQAKQTQTRSTPVVLASAEQVSPEATSDAAPPPVKHRAARVTTCRCGGEPQAAQPEEQ
jgi:hypothetical protein